MPGVPDSQRLSASYHWNVEDLVLLLMYIGCGQHDLDLFNLRFNTLESHPSAKKVLAAIVDGQLLPRKKKVWQIPRDKAIQYIVEIEPKAQKCDWLFELGKATHLGRRRDQVLRLRFEAAAKTLFRKVDSIGLIPLPPTFYVSAVQIVDPDVEIQKTADRTKVSWLRDAAKRHGYERLLTSCGGRPSEKHQREQAALMRIAKTLVKAKQ